MLIDSELEDYKKVAKGTKYGVKERNIKHEHYRASLFNLETIYMRQNVIMSRDHNLGSYHQCQASLTTFDTKRLIHAD